MPKLVKRMPRFVRRAQAYSAPGRPEWWQTGMGFGHTAAGVPINARNAITLPAFGACVRVISEDVASLPLAVYKKQPGGGSRLINDHDITWRFGRSPDGDAREMSSMQWREAWVTHCLTRGNGFAEIEWSGAGDILGLHLLNPDCTEEYRKSRASPDGPSNPLQYRTEGNKYLAAADVLHLAMPGFNGVTGFSPVALLREAIGLGKAAEQFGASFFGSGAMPKGVLTYPGKLSPEARTNLRADWNTVHQGAGNAHKIAVLVEGMGWTNTQVNPDEAQFHITRQFQVVEIARIFRVPPHKIGDYTQSHLANIEASNLDYLETVLRPWCLRIEECLNLKLLTDSEVRRGYYVRHDMRALLRASTKDRALYYNTMFQMGMSADEIRDLEDLNPIGAAEGGTKRFRSVNYVDLTAEAPAPSAPAAPGGGQDQPKNGGQTSKNGRFSHENGVI